MNMIEYKPVKSVVSEGRVDSLDHCYSSEVFTTAGSDLNVYAHSRNQPVHSYSDFTDGYIKIKHNPVEVPI